MINIGKYWKGFNEKTEEGLISILLRVYIFKQNFLYPEIPMQLDSVCEISHV